MQLSDFRKQYPQYDDMPDADLAASLHKKYYSDLDYGEFSQRIGLGDQPVMGSAAAPVPVAMQPEPVTLRGAATPLPESMDSGLQMLFGDVPPAAAEQPEPRVNVGALLKQLRHADEPHGSFRAAKPPEEQAADRHYTNLVHDDSTGMEEPWFNPVDAASAGFGAGAKVAANVALKTPIRAVLKMATPRALARGVTAAGPAALMDLPIGTLADLAEADENTALAFMTAIGAGLFSGATVEPFLDNKVYAAASRVAKRYADHPKIAALARKLGVGQSPREKAREVFDRMKGAAVEQSGETSKEPIEDLADGRTINLGDIPAPNRMPTDELQPGPAQRSAEVFQQDFEQADRLRKSPQGKVLLRDLLADQEHEGIENIVSRGQEFAQANPDLTNQMNRVPEFAAVDPKLVTEAARRGKLDEITQRLRGRQLADLEDGQLMPEKLALEHDGRDDLARLVQGEIDLRAARRKAAQVDGKATQGPKGETLRYAINSMGGLDILHFKGEGRDIPPMVRRSILKRGGMPLDLAERQLKDDGWLDESENLLELLRSDPEALRRRHPGHDIADRNRNLTGTERRLKEELNWQPEAPDDKGFDDLPFELQEQVAAGKMDMDAARIAARSGNTGQVPFAMAGGAAGVEQDEQGNIAFDPKKALAGMAVGAAGAYGIKRIGSFKQIRLSPAKEKELVELNFKEKKTAREYGEIPSILLTGGPPGAGKSTSVKALNIDKGKRVQADADLIKEQAGYDDRAAEFHETSSRINKEIARRAIDEGYHLTYDSLMTNSPLADDLIQQVLSKNGTVNIAFTNIDPITSVVRSNARVDAGLSRRKIPVEASLKGYNRALPTFVELFKKYRDNPRVKFSLVDNNVDGRPAVTVFTKRAKGLEIFDEKLFDDIINTDYNKLGSGKEARYERSETATRQSLTNHKETIQKRTARIVSSIREGAKGRVRGSDGRLSGVREDNSHSAVKPSSSKKPTLYLHPSTVTGPIGGLASGVDWEEFDKTGQIKIDPKKALVGAMAGAAGGAAIGPARRLGVAIVTRWDKQFAEPFVSWARRTANGLIVSEELRHGLGLNRSQTFQDMMRDHRRDVERAWNTAAEVGREIQKIAPTKLEQRRLMQVVCGGITASDELRAKAEKVNKLFADLREQLKEYHLLEYSRFDKLTRKERAKLRNIIAKSKETDRIREKEFNRAYDIGPDPKPARPKAFDPSDPGGAPKWATERVPIDAYSDKPKTSSDWAREKLHDHYHFASAQEYAPIYYNKHEGLTPKQKDTLRDELNRMKVKSRRGNPEGKPELEAMITEMEQMLGEGWKARRELRKTRSELNKRYSHRRIEIPHEIQQILGKIEEAPFPIAKMAGVQKTDVIKQRMFSQIAERADWALPARMKNPRTGEYTKVHHEPPANFVKVDDDRFGALDGTYVRKDIWEDLREVEEWRGAFVRNWDKLMGAWKYGKVVLNPATHARNTMSNLILAYLGDVNPADVKTYGKALKAVRQGEQNAHYKEADDWGLFNNTFITSEITKLRDELDGLRDVGSLKGWIRKAASLPAEVYQGNEKFFKMAVFIKARGDGATVDEAARKAEKFLFNYADIPPWVKHMKRWVSPFFTFTYKAIPLFAEMAIRKPWKVAAIVGSMYGMEQYAVNKLGMSREEADKQRRLLPEWQQRKTLGIGPYNHVLMPFRDKWGNNLYLDMSYILPYGNLGEKWGQSALPLSDLLPSSPMFGVLSALATNKDSFTGREIYNEVLDGAGAITAKYLDYAWKEIAPSLMPGGHGFNKLKTGIQNTFMGKDVRDWADRPVEFSTAVLSTLMGIKLSPANQRKLAQFELTTRRRIDAAVDREKGRFTRQYQQNRIDKDELKREIEQLNQIKKKLLQERPKP
ncbi:MAG: zeta toxin family protein [Desulfosarcina sp.]|nr:zeta toxin family protein [Desulfosarcina sp.]MBC2764512.1 hypothetical protein [Desulfosarcina sp.]